MPQSSTGFLDAGIDRTLNLPSRSFFTACTQNRSARVLPGIGALGLHTSATSATAFKLEEEYEPLQPRLAAALPVNAMSLPGNAKRPRFAGAPMSSARYADVRPPMW